MDNIIFAITVVTIIIVSLYMVFDNDHLVFGREGFNNQTGFYCSSCDNKSINQCLRCFNCGFADFADGGGMCLEGGNRGPFNKHTSGEDKMVKYSVANNDGTYNGLYRTHTNDTFPNKNVNYYLWKDNYKGSNLRGKVINRWYHIDPYSYMIQRADDFECAKPKINNNNKVMVYKNK